jgi:signal transduction histidine kinase
VLQPKQFCTFMLQSGPKSCIMSGGVFAKLEGAPAMPVPVLAQMLFTTINEHEAALARVSKLLHDDVSQVLSAVGLQLDALKMDFSNQAPGIDQRASEIQTILEHAIEQLRDISNELNPSIVERAGLHLALDRLADKARKDFSGTIRLHFDPAVRIPSAAAKTFYKIGECAVQNALARPGCSLIDIHVKRSHGEFVLEISDNGRVDETAAGELPLGQLLLNYYASQASLTIQSSPQKGTVIRAAYPIEEART